MVGDKGPLHGDIHFFLPASFIVETILFPLCVLGAFVPNQLPISTGVYFWALCPALRAYGVFRCQHGAGVPSTGSI